MRTPASFMSPLGQCRHRAVVLIGVSATLAGTLLLSSCEKKKSKSTPKQQASAQPTGEPAVMLTPTPVAEANPADIDGQGTAPSFVTPENFNPYSTVTPQTGSRMNAMMNEVANLIYGFNARYQAFTVESYTPTALETEATGCANTDLQQSIFTASGSGYTISGRDPNHFKTCINNTGNRVTNPYKTEAQWNVDYDCQGQQYDLNNIGLTDTRVSRGLCETGTAATFRFNGSVTAQEFGDASLAQVVRFFKRTIAISNNAGGNCAWTWNDAEKVKVFNDCVFLDRVDGNNQTSTRFVLVTFDRVVGQTSNSGGFLYTGGVANVIYNNWRGQIAFDGTNRPKWVMKQDGSNTQLTGELAVPAGHGGQPSVQPGIGVTGNSPTNLGDTGFEAYVPAGGPGTNEVRCASSITTSNINSEGNGVVPLYAFQSGSSTYYTGYVHESPNAEKQAFVARVANDQLVWCRTLATQVIGRSQGAFVGLLGGSLYVVFVSNQNNYPVVGTSYMGSHPAVGRDVAYIARLSEWSGNLLNATWFDFTTNGGGNFPTILIDEQAVAADQVRLRAYLANAQAPTCQRAATGEYAVGLKRDLSGIASTAQACP